jgi:hypothetical protein
MTRSEQKTPPVASLLAQHGLANQAGHHNKQEVRIDSLHVHLPGEPAQLDPEPKPEPEPKIKTRFWLELDRLQHQMCLLGGLAMLVLTILCCWPSTQTVPALMPLLVVLSLAGTAGFGYFYYTERAFKC